MSESKKPFRVAVLSVPKHAYVPLGVASHPRFELVVVADDASQPDWVHERNEKFARERGIPYLRNVEEALARHDAQAAVISSQAERHCDLAVRAARAGMHVIIDKPMSTRLSECDRLVQAVEKAGVRFLMWNRNGLPAVQQARELLARGELGRLFALHLDFYFAKDAGPAKGTRPADQPVTPWLSHQIAAHGDGSDGSLGVEPMGELGCEGIYPLAYVRMLTGAKVRRVYCRAAARFHQIYADHGVEDLATLTLEMDNGLLATLALGRIGVASHPDLGEIKLHLLGERGALVVGESRPEIGVYYRGQPEAEFRHRRVAVTGDLLLMENFARAIDTGESTLLDVRASRDIAATVFAAVESARLNRPVEVPELQWS